mmetsp:Transcript_56240/g.134014  ORF Transcript_56240/g.134014 Transcript_56240/m.134014 type:complete len:395 (+) Transcript_56240:80-1264(+)
MSLTFVSLASPAVAPAEHTVPTLPVAAAKPGSPASLSGGNALPILGLATAAGAAAVSRRKSKRNVACEAAKVKKKGVRVVEGREIPWNIFMPKAPYKAKCISNETISQKTSLVNWETTHVIIDHKKNVPYLEGQSVGVIAPGPDKKGEAPAKVRLYSIASSACGDDESFNTVSLCVKRVVEVSGKGWCEYSNVEPGTDPEFPDAEKVYRGVCSSHICDLKVGDDCLLTGPTGAEMLLPEDPTSNIIMMATGTGIAPFRSFLRFLFNDKATKSKFKGKAWLFLGVPFTKSLLYDEEWKAMKKEFPDQFDYDYAISDEMKRPDGKSMYVQHVMQQKMDKIWPMVKDSKTHVYMCGLKGMASGFEEAIAESCEKEGLDVKEYIKQMKKADRYHVEVY